MPARSRREIGCASFAASVRGRRDPGSKPNTVVRFDPRSAKFQSWAVPGGGNIVSNTSVTKDGQFVLANSLVNAVTLVTISK